MTTTDVPRTTRLSPYLHQLDRIVAHSAAVGIVAVVTVGSSIALAVAGFPDFWESVFSVVAWSITLVMVFVLHHTQRREQVATQLKLDELIRALPTADDRFVRVQASEDDEVAELEQELIEHHHATHSA